MVTCENDVIKKGLILLENKDYDGAIGVFADAEKFSREIMREIKFRLH